MIRNNPLAVVLISILFLLALVCLWSATWWLLRARELQSLHYQGQSMRQSAATVQGLANEAMEYSKRNPAIDGILQEYEVKPRAGAAPTASPRPVR